jgi:hypothetical protein
MIGFMPRQGQAAAFGCLPGSAAESAHCIAFGFETRYREFGHLVHFARVVGGRVPVVGEKSGAFLADRRRVAWHANVGYPIVSPGSENPFFDLYLSCAVFRMAPPLT